MKTLMLLILILCITVPVYAQEDGDPDAEPDITPWDYSDPAGWGDLDNDFSLCGTGNSQSPIDITTANIVFGELPPILFNYQSEPLTLSIRDNSITLTTPIPEAVDTEDESENELPPPATNNSITYNEVVYPLERIVFRSPAEHTIDGDTPDMEIQFVHFDDAGNPAVIVAVLVSEFDTENLLFTPLLENLPEEFDPDVGLDATVNINPADLLPVDRTYLTYEGSLSTPPCTESIDWLLLDGIQGLSGNQIDTFTAIVEDNVRPIQERGNRPLNYSAPQ